MLSLSMIVKNEEENLKDCLESVEGVVDEIVVVDTGSTDKTKEIAASYNAQIYDYEWINDFAAARNYSLSKCSGKMVLYLDADERLDKNSKASLKSLLKSESKAYNCKILNVDKVNNRPSVMTYVRLFPKIEGVQFTGKVHEQIEKSLIENNIKIEESNVTINHIGYSRDKEELKVKARRNLEILKDEYQNTKSSYVAFHLGQSYNILEDEELAKEYFQLAIKDNTLKNEYRATAFRVLAVYQIEKNNLELASKLVNNALSCDKNQPMIYLVAAQLFEKSGDSQKQIENLKLALKKNEDASKHNYKSSQNIFVDDYLIICTGIKAALQAGNNDEINFFWNKLQLVSKSSSEMKSEITVINKILQSDFKDLTSKNILNCINDSNLELFIVLFNVYADNELLQNVFESLYEQNKKKIFVLREFALYKFNKGDHKSAEGLFKIAIEKNIPDPAIYFYLISIYLQQNRLDELPNILSSIVERFGDNPNVLSKLNVLQQKLQQMQIAIS